MKMRHLIVAFLFDGAEVEIAVRALARSDAAMRCRNDRAGVHAFVTWLGEHDLIGEQTRLHACVATTGAQDDPFFASAFFEFANEFTSDTFVWPAGRLQEALGIVSPSAIAMLDGCRETHHRAEFA